MARLTKPLTNTEVKQAKARDKEYNLSDGYGLMLRIKPNGSKSWVFNYYRPLTKKRTNLSFGTYPEISLAEARALRQNARNLLAKDLDPKIEKEEQLNAKKEELENTFLKFAIKWYTLKSSSVKEETIRKAWQTLEKHILPFIGNYSINRIKPKILIEILRPIEAKGSLETVKRLCRYTNEIMRLAVASGAIELNPLSDLTKLFASPQRKHMATIKPDELPELMIKLREANILKVTRLLVEWQLHTMTRPSEAAKAKWEEINLEEKTWIIPADRMKMKKAHTIPLTTQTLNILNELKMYQYKSDYIFPSHRNRSSHVNPQSANMALKRMGYEGKLVSHGLRALASTSLNEQGFDPEIIEAALAHADKNEVRRAYNRAEYIERRRKMMHWWSEHIENSRYENNVITGTIKNLTLLK